MGTKILMGVLEAAYKPCEIYYLALFYIRKEIAFRVSRVGQMGYIAMRILAVNDFDENEC